MKISTLIITVAFALVISHPAVAGGRHYKGSYYGNHYSKHYYPKRHYYGGYRRRGHYAEAALGGLIVGGIIGSALTSSHYKRPYPVRNQVYISSYSGNVATENTFWRESNGDCFLITYNSRGNRVLSSVPASNCE